MFSPKMVSNEVPNVQKPEEDEDREALGGNRSATST